MRTMKFINIILSDQLYIKSYNIPEKKTNFIIYNRSVSFCLMVSEPVLNIVRCGNSN